MRILLSVFFVLPWCFYSILAQPAAYFSRGVRSYLVNYSAIKGDRYLAEFAAKRFVMIDESRSIDIKMIHDVNPDMPILRYKDMVALSSHYAEYPSVNIDETAFMHSCEPSGTMLVPTGNQFNVSWLPDRRELPIIGYRLYWMADSLSMPNLITDSVLFEKKLSVAFPQAARYVMVASELETGEILNYGFPVRISNAESGGPQCIPDEIIDARTTDMIDISVSMREIGPVRPDSVFIIADWNRNNSLHQQLERRSMLFLKDRWRHTYGSSIAGIRTYGGYEFIIEAWKDGVSHQYPKRGKWHTNVNNRLKHDYYGFYVMNVANSTWRNAYISEVLKAFTRDGYTGLFEDDCWYKVSNYGCDSYPPEPYDEHEWRPGLFQMMDSIRLAIAPKPAYFNGLSAEISDSLLLFAAGAMTEGFACTHWSGLLGGSSWKNQCNRGLSAQHKSARTWLALGGTQTGNELERLYVLGSYLLIEDSLSMLGNAITYQDFAHYPEFDIPLGKPLESAGLDIDDLGHDLGAAGYYRREFELGTVVVNPGSKPIYYPDGQGRGRIALEGGLTIEGGRVQTSYLLDSIQPRSAHIYLNQPPGELIESPIIDSIIVNPSLLPADGTTECNIRILAHDVSSNVFKSDPSLPLHVVLDAGAVGGPANLSLITTPGIMSGEMAWYEGRFTVPVGAPPDTALLPVSVFSSTGLMVVAMVEIRLLSADSANLLLNYSFEIDNNGDRIPDLWNPYVKGFEYDMSGINAKSGARSIHVKNDSLSEFRGVSVLVELNQQVPQSIFLAGWSKCINVSGDMNNDYSLYADIRYQDGTALYGQTARFNTGTHDWEYSAKIIEPEKPIKNLSLYVLFRRHTGDAWFDHITLMKYDPTPIKSPSTVEDLQLQIFPNPTRGTIKVFLAIPESESAEIAIYDIHGRMRKQLHSGQFHHIANTLTYHLDGLPSGTYMLRLVCGSKSIYKQFSLLR